MALGGLHVTSLPEEAARHADTIFLGPGEDTWPAFLADFRAGRPGKVYRSRHRSLVDAPAVRRDLIKRHLYLVPNSLVVSRGCPHTCDFCYKRRLLSGRQILLHPELSTQRWRRSSGCRAGTSTFWTTTCLAKPRFAAALFEGMTGMGRLWQAAGTVHSVLDPGLAGKGGGCGLRSLFVGFETLSAAQSAGAAQGPQPRPQDYGRAIRRLHDLGVMVNASFVFGMDEDDETVFERTVEWAVEQGIETATFHILTPYPGTPLHRRLAAQGRITTENWDLYDTRHAVFRPARMTAERLEAGYWRAYQDFYSWRAIFKSAGQQERWGRRLRHLAYAGGWKKLEPAWDWIISSQQVARLRPALEAVLNGAGRTTAADRGSGKCIPHRALAPAPNAGEGATLAKESSASEFAKVFPFFSLRS